MQEGAVVRRWVLRQHRERPLPRRGHGGPRGDDLLGRDRPRLVGPGPHRGSHGVDRRQGPGHRLEVLRGAAPEVGRAREKRHQVRGIPGLLARRVQRERPRGRHAGAGQHQLRLVLPGGQPLAVGAPGLLRHQPQDALPTGPVGEPEHRRGPSAGELGHADDVAADPLRGPGHRPIVPAHVPEDVSPWGRRGCGSASGWRCRATRGSSGSRRSPTTWTLVEEGRSPVPEPGGNADVSPGLVTGASVPSATSGGQWGCQASWSAVRALTGPGREPAARSARLTFSKTSRSELRAAIQTSWRTSAFSL